MVRLCMFSIWFWVRHRLTAHPPGVRLRLLTGMLSLMSRIMLHRFFTDCTLVVVILLKSMTWAHQAAVLGWQAAVLLISYFAAFTLGNCPQFTSVLGELCWALTRRAAVNERFGLTSRTDYGAEWENVPHSESMFYLVKMNWLEFRSFIVPIKFYWECIFEYYPSANTPPLSNTINP